MYPLGPVHAGVRRLVFLSVAERKGHHASHRDRKGCKERKVCMPTTCGQGLAERSTLPAKLSALSAAMADNLEKRQRTLDFTDHNARAENDAYDAVARALRNAATELQAIADRMASYSALPMPRHDQRAATSADIRDAFALFVEREVDLSVLLSSLIQQDREMLAQWDRMAAT